MYPEQVPVHVGDVGKEYNGLGPPIVDHPAEDVRRLEHVLDLHALESKRGKLDGHEVAVQIPPFKRTNTAPAAAAKAKVKVTPHPNETLTCV